MTWTSPRSFAGSISTETPDMPNNTLFFWGFETFNGSITSTNSSDPWVVYLAGGPGYSSMASALVENIGPNIMTPSGLARNEYSWHNFTDVVCRSCDLEFRISKLLNSSSSSTRLLVPDILRQDWEGRRETRRGLLQISYVFNRFIF